MSPAELEQIIHRVIKLADELATESDRFPPESDPFSQGEDYFERNPFHNLEPPKRNALDDYLDSLDLEVLSCLQAVMYCGRDGHLDVLGFREDLAPYRHTDVVRKLREKRRVLSQYLRVGLESVGRQFHKLVAQPLPVKRPVTKMPVLRGPNEPTLLPERLPRPQRPAPARAKQPPTPPKIPGYVVAELLGKGGNGEVWKCSDPSNSALALKHFTKPGDPKRLARFRNEVAVLKDLRQQSLLGVVPLLASGVDTEPYFYVMPLGLPAASNFESTLAEGIEALSQLASTLVRLHENQIFHRDIKPENILKVEGVWCLSDFGLAEFPEAEQVTTEGEEIGPYFNKPPEMRRAAHAAEAGPADVYMFAKTAWMLLTGDLTGFDGQFDASVPHLSLRQRFPDDTMAAIEHVLYQATAYDPKERPPMRELARVFRDWLLLKDDFRKRMMLEWEYMIRQIFPARTPHRTQWTDRDSIVHILGIICQTSALNHGFFPDGGGCDLEAIQPLNSDQILLSMMREYEAKPLRLELVVWPKAVEWSYLFLELAPLEPTGVGAISPDGFCETFVEFPNGLKKHPEILVKGGEYVGDEFVPLARPYQCKDRLLRGSLVFFGKASTYNHTPSTYDGRHQNLGREGFYQYIQKHVSSG